MRPPATTASPGAGETICDIRAERRGKRFRLGWGHRADQQPAMERASVERRRRGRIRAKTWPRVGIATRPPLPYPPCDMGPPIVAASTYRACRRADERSRTSDFASRPASRRFLGQDAVSGTRAERPEISGWRGGRQLLPSPRHRRVRRGASRRAAARLSPPLVPPARRLRSRPLSLAPIRTERLLGLVNHLFTKGAVVRPCAADRGDPAAGAMER